MARAMLHIGEHPECLWAEAINTVGYIINRVYFHPGTKKTPYELWKNKKPNVSYFKTFGCRCFVMLDGEQLGKFDARSREGIFVGYCENSRAYRIYFKNSKKIVDSINVRFDDEILAG